MRVLIFTRRASGRSHHMTRGVHLKHKLSKREYKGVLSKTYGGAILRMHMCQGKGGWGLTCRSFDLASPELRVPDFEVRSVHESITYHHSITPLWCPSRLPHEKARHSTHTCLGKFYKYSFKLSNNQAKLSKQSITAYTAIRIVLLTLQGCTTFTHVSSLTAFDLATVQEVTARMLTTTFTSQPI